MMKNFWNSNLYKKIYECNNCGDRNIEIHAYGTWDIKSQSMSMDEISSCYCYECDDDWGYNVVYIPNNNKKITML